MLERLTGKKDKLLISACKLMSPLYGVAQFIQKVSFKWVLRKYIAMQNI